MVTQACKSPQRPVELDRSYGDAVKSNKISDLDTKPPATNSNATPKNRPEVNEFIPPSVAVEPTPTGIDQAYAPGHNGSHHKHSHQRRH